MSRLLVTGWDGFVGNTLQQMVGADNFHKFELVIPSCPIELRDPASVTQAVRETKPDYVIHLAAQSFVPASIADPRTTYEVNFFGTLNLLEALQAEHFTGRLIYVSSGDVYGLVPSEALPISESRSVQPRNPYAVSKAAAEMLCCQWVQTNGFDIVLVRPFNHIGPGQSDRFVVSDFAKQIVECKLKLREPLLSVGATDTTRDMTDVRDVVQAYLLLLEKGVKGDIYNVCSGREQSIGEILEKLMKLAQVNCRIVQDTARMRPAEQKRMYGSFEKLNQQTGWTPTIHIDQSLQDILRYWESEFRNV
jgi:GDP-4-dehydro-6-deoxy-D-mannose reductase